MSGSVTILGGGNTAFAVAANLALTGVEVTLCEISGFEAAVAPIRASRQIELNGVAKTGVATLQQVTMDFGEALSTNDVVLLIIPSYGHRAFAEACAPHLRDGQIVVLMPGNLGSLEFAKIVRDCGGAEIVLAETDTAPYVCRKLTPTSATIWGVVNAMGCAAFPSRENERVQQTLELLFPGIQLYDHVLACGLAAMNPVVHPAGVLLNAGRIEYSRGDFYFYEEGVMPGVCNLIYAVDRERLAVAETLGAKLPPVDEAFHLAGFGPQGDLWSTINGSRMLTQLRAPGSLQNRWLTEDVPYGIASWCQLGNQLGVECPTIASLVQLISAMSGTDFWNETRTPARLGIANLEREALLALVADGPT